MTGQGTRERLLATARDLLETTGGAGVGLVGLSKASGISNGSIYHHFGSKDGVLAAVLESPPEAFRTSGREGTILEVNALGEGGVRLPEAATINVQRFVTGKNVIHVRGGLCGDAVPALHRIIVEELSRFPALLTLQLSGVASIDGAGIDALVRASSLAGESDISLCLTGVRGGPVVAALVADGVIERFKIFESVADAWEHVR